MPLFILHALPKDKNLGSAWLCIQVKRKPLELKFAYGNGCLGPLTSQSRVVFWKEGEIEGDQILESTVMDTVRKQVTKRCLL